jgi:hypothetical protein
VLGLRRDHLLIKAAAEGRLCELVEVQDISGAGTVRVMTAIPRNFSFNHDHGFLESPIEVCVTQAL